MIVTFGIVSAFKLTHVVAGGDVIIASVISRLWITATFPRLDEFPSENHSANTPEAWKKKRQSGLYPHSDYADYFDYPSGPNICFRNAISCKAYLKERLMGSKRSRRREFLKGSAALVGGLLGAAA